MPRFRLIIAACLATFAVGAVASTAALAASWHVNGTELKGSAALASSAQVLTPGELSITAGEKLSIVCEGENLSITGGKLIAPAGILARSITFHECKTKETPNCTLGSTLILVLPVHGLLHFESPNLLILVLPTTKTTFTTIKFNGEKCALLGTQPVTGGASILIHNVTTSEPSHFVLAFSSVGGLKVGSDEATLKGVSGDLKLASGESWSFL